MRPRLPILILVAAGVAAGAAPASAATYCVSLTDPACTTDVQTALDAAEGNPGLDTVQIGAGTFTGAGGSDNAALSYHPASSEPVEIVGAGTDDTVLASVAGPSHTLAVVPGSVAGTVVRDLAVEVPPGATRTGIRLIQPTAAPPVSLRRVAITQQDTTSGATGVSGVAATVEDSRIELSTAESTRSVAGLDVATLTVVRSTVTAGTYGVRGATALTVDRSLLRASSPGSFHAVVSASAAGSVRNSVLRPETGGFGVYVATNPGADASVHVDGTTIVAAGCESVVPRGPACTDGAALNVYVGHAGRQATVEATRSVLGARFAARASAAAGSTATVAIGHSDLDQTAIVRTGAGTTTVDASDANVGADPRFVDPAADLRPRWDSPLVDAGGTTPPAPGELDLDGLERMVGAQRDIGAYEYRHREPVARASASATAVVAGTPVTFSAQGSEDPDPFETASLTYAWSFDDGGAATGETATRAFSQAGPRRATVTVTDPDGQSATASVVVTVSEAPALPGPPAPPAPPAPPTVTERSAVAPPVVRPTILSLRLGAGAFRPSRRGVRLTYVLSAPAKVRFTVARRVGRRWVAVKGSLTRTGAAGTNRTTFTGRVGGRVLRPGRYRLTATVAGSPPRTVTFRITTATR